MTDFEIKRKEPMVRKKILMFGSYVADLTGTADRLPRAAETVFGHEFKIGPGGKGSNQAIAAYRAGGDVILVTKLGNDVFGNQAKDFYKKEGINTEYVLTDNNFDTGVALICVDETSGQNQILVVPGACMNFSDDDINKLYPAIKDADILLVQHEVNLDALERVIRVSKEKGLTVILNPAPAREISDSMKAAIDIVTPNEVEAEFLTGVKVENEKSASKAADIFHSWGIDVVIITMGCKGAFVSDGKRRELIHTRKVRAIDTTGAGDAFNGGFVVAFSEGKNIFEAVKFANTVGALSVQRKGTAPSMPCRKEIEEALIENA
jgi:ribokinase